MGRSDHDHQPVGGGATPRAFFHPVRSIGTTITLAAPSDIQQPNNTRSLSKAIDTFLLTTIDESVVDTESPQTLTSTQSAPTLDGPKHPRLYHIPNNYHSLNIKLPHSSARHPYHHATGFQDRIAPRIRLPRTPMVDATHSYFPPISPFTPPISLSKLFCSTTLLFTSISQASIYSPWWQRLHGGGLPRAFLPREWSLSSHKFLPY